VTQVARKMATEALSLSQGASLGDFPIAPACPIEKATLKESLIYLTPGSETDEFALT